MSRLQQTLRAEGQRVPVDVPQSEQATLGGALAVNVSGPRRFGWGTFRDYVIGIRMVNDNGEEFKAGGRVVKNVAGYDICKLAVGSLGTLGIITEVTLKLRPVPEDQALALIPCADAESIIACLHQTRTQPVCLELLNRAAARSMTEQGWLIIVGYEGNRASVAWQVEQLSRELGDVGQGIDARLHGSADPLWERLVEFPAAAGASLLFKANVLPRSVVSFCRQAAELLPEMAIQAHAGNGIVLGRADAPLTIDSAAPTIETLRRTAVKAQGNLVVLHCPEEWKHAIGVWGPPRDDWAVMRAVKRSLDPDGIFNPGRFVDGI
jgi:glycolate oxidase FAD binding subunit